MFSKKIHRAWLLPVVLLAGCASHDEAAKAPAEPVAALPSDGCTASAVQSLIGHPVNPGVLEQARLQAGAQRARVLRPGTAVTLEYDSQRLNLDTDDADVITRASCG
jgi:hypothetical protein